MKHHLLLRAGAAGDVFPPAFRGGLIEANEAAYSALFLRAFPPAFRGGLIEAIFSRSPAMSC